MRKQAACGPHPHQPALLHQVSMIMDVVLCFHCILSILPVSVHPPPSSVPCMSLPSIHAIALCCRIQYSKQQLPLSSDQLSLLQESILVRLVDCCCSLIEADYEGGPLPGTLGRSKEERLRGWEVLPSFSEHMEYLRHITGWSSNRSRPQRLCSRCRRS